MPLFAGGPGRGMWLALAAGAAPWRSGDDPRSSVHRLVGFIEVGALLTSLGTVWAPSLGADRSFTPAAIASVSVIALLIDPVLLVFRRPPVSRNVPFYLFVHGAMLVLVGLCLLAVLPGWAALFSLSLGVALGADASLTMLDLGWSPRPLQWWVDFFTSPLHIGIVGGFVAAAVAGRASTLQDLLPIYVTIQLWFIVALLTAWCIADVVAHLEDDRLAIAADIRKEENRRRAHWLHDDVCAQLRAITLRVQTAETDSNAIVRMLDDLDHQIRLRQLNEFSAAGPVTVAEVLQPYIRRAQNLGVRIAAVPGYEEGSVELDETEARRLARAAGVLSSNAVNAGAGALRFDISTDGAALRLTITDDGPGLRAADVPAGRGLWTLGRELAPGGITVLDVDVGAAVQATIPLDDPRSDLVHDSAD
jgi:signal transduction histidine kinase